MSIAGHVVVALVCVGGLALVASGIWLLYLPRRQWDRAQVHGKYLVEPFGDPDYDGAMRFRLCLAARLGAGAEAQRIPIHPLGHGDSFASESEAAGAGRELELLGLPVVSTLSSWPHLKCVLPVTPRHTRRLACLEILLGAICVALAIVQYGG